ncbi:MAG TPA: sulfotransferase family 2 domain-containing protein [Solirubrobacteraceae bacterium]|nr:sulfotransferase family 2 domain-containing protein [Solirubrobacteraceae bacterium]
MTLHPSMEPPFSRHVLQRTVVLPELRVLFVPVPKAGCTTVLWRLAALAGIEPEAFERSTLAEASAALTVHDMSLWRPEHRLATYEGEERERVLGEDGWLRFSLVRDPATRLWSAWQSKLLLREPRFLEAFGAEPWFPRVPERPADIVEDFRRFVAATGGAEDVHWAVQHDVVAQLPLTHVGRVERLDETLALLRAHVGAERWPAADPPENRSPLPLPPHAFDAGAAALVSERYRVDYEAYGYEGPPVARDETAWEERAAALIPFLRATIDQHARLGQLHRVALRRLQRAESAEARLETASAERVGHARSPVLTNLEQESDFTVRWAWAERELEPGLTGVVRVKDEARSLPWVLPPLLRAVRRVVLIDNGSTDGTPAVARAVAEEHGAADRLEVHHYPFAIARCGDEHLAAPADSVHSLAYFYNWSFSHVRTTYALKWDGDMVLSDRAVSVLRDLAWQLEAADVVVKVPRYPLYIADDRHAFLDTGLRNTEPWGWRNRPGHSFAKALDWELPLWRSDIPTLTLPDWSCVELKHLDADEFAHWSHTDFDASARTKRKRREWEVFNVLAGGAAPPDGVIPVRSPDDRHVIDYVRSEWLPARHADPAHPRSARSRAASLA